MPVTPFDYHHEKTALVALARWLTSERWSEVGLSVPTASVDATGELGGVAPPEIDEAFIERFNTHPRHRYTFYRDEPGRIDLVARRDEITLLVEAKGKSVANRRGAIEQLIGRLVLLRQPERADIEYGVLIPDSWEPVLPTSRDSLDWISVFRVTPAGAITRGGWPATEAGAGLRQLR